MAGLLRCLIILTTCALLVNCGSWRRSGQESEDSSLSWGEGLRELLSPFSFAQNVWDYMGSFFTSGPQAADEEVERETHYIPLGKPCDPRDEDSCVWSSKCNPRTKICDCADSDDGIWRRTFQNNDCRLLPGSTCIVDLDQDFYRCVENSECTITRQGVDPRTCLADAPCDTGDSECICPPGKNCLSRKVAAKPF